MKQKILTLFVALLTGLAAWAHDFEVDGIFYKITSSTDLTVCVSYRGSSHYDYSNEYSGAVVIPESVTYSGKSYSVTGIGYEAFRGCSGLTSVVIPSSVTSIGSYAFYDCSGLTSVEIGSSVTSIGGYAFYDCSGLTSVVIPSSVTSIGSSAFSGCSGLTSITIPSSVTSIGERAFNGCTSIKNLIIEDSSETLSLGYNYYNSSGTGKGLFYDCPLETVYLGRNISYKSDKQYGYSPFYNEKSKITELTIGELVTSISDYAFYGCSGLASVVIPSSVTSIGDYAFRDCRGLTSVVIPSSVTWIDNGAFYGCRGLTSVVIPSSVTWIGESAFNGCTSIKNLIIEDSSETLSLGYNYYYSSGTGEGLFYDCPLETVYLGRNISYISDKNFGYSPFYNGKSKITELTIGELVTSISDYAFYGCSGLTSVVIPSSVTSIGDYAFRDCRGLTSVVIPSSVTWIGQEAFYNVTKAFFLANTKPSIGSDAFKKCKVYYTANNDSYSIPGTHKVYSLLSSMFEVDGVKYIPTSMSQRTCDMVDVDYSAESVNSAIGPTVKYTNSSGRQYDFKVNNVNMCAGYECNSFSNLSLDITGAIEDYSFYYYNGNGKISKISLGDEITSIGKYCFYGFSNVEHIKFGKKIASVGFDSFWLCSSLTSVELNDELTSIGSNAFQNCSKLASLTIPANVSTISSGAFDGCTSIGDLTFEDSETAINLACRFPSVKNIYMGRNVTYSMSNSSPFSGNNNLENVTTSMYVTNVPNYAFYNCKALKDVYLSDGVRTIGTYVFSGDIALTNFEVGMSVESIGAEAFSDCTALLEFTSHSIVPATVGTEALDDIDKLECTLHVPEGTEDAYMAADQWKEFWIDGDLLPRYKVVATVDPECAGMGTVKGSNGYDKNTTAKLEAIPAENYVFVEWSDGNKQNPRTMTVTGATNLTAKFAYRYYIKTQPTANNISVALSEMVSGVVYKWYVSESAGGVKNITNDLQSTGSYAWTKSGGVWTSGNKGVHSSSSTLSMDITAKAGDKLTFDYSVSSESGYDYLKIYLGSNQIGNSYSGSASGTYEYTFTSDMNTTLKFVYSKDGSGDNGSDQATISNVVFEGEATATLLEGETTRTVSASSIEKGKYYYCEIVMPDGTILTSNQVQSADGNTIVTSTPPTIEKSEGGSIDILDYDSETGTVLIKITPDEGCQIGYIMVDGVVVYGSKNKALGEIVVTALGNDNYSISGVNEKNKVSVTFVSIATGIEDITISRPVREGIYDLMGRKLSAPQRGINIIDGKKVIVK